MYCNSDCTLYHDNGNGYDVTYFKNCFWYETDSNSTGKDGLTKTSSVRLVIPSMSEIDCGYKDFFVKGKGAAINNKSAETISAGVKALGKIHAVSSISAKLYGSSVMQHYEFDLR